MPAIAGELYGFTLSRTNNGLSVNIQSDMPESSDITYTNNGASISLPAMQASQQLVNSGLPIVIDDANTTIGRAVPQQDGSVAILLPNVDQNTAIKVNFVGRQAAITPIAATINGSSLPASGQAHFDAALKAAKTPTITKPVSKPTKPALVSPPQPSTSSNQSVKLSPATVSKRTRPLPKVVPLTPEQPTSVAAVSQTPQTPVNRKPDERYGDNAEVESYSANTDWFTSEDLPEVSGNAYGVLGVDSTLVPIPPEPTNTWLNSSKQFLDNISGNWFSRPYGVAFWGMVMAVLLLAGGGFVLVAIGLLLARLAFKPSAFVSSSHSTNADEQAIKTQNMKEQPAHTPMEAGMQATIARYSQMAATPRKPSPFISLKSPSPTAAAHKTPSISQVNQQVNQRPQRSSLWERLNKSPNSSVTATQSSTSAATHSVNSGNSLRHRLKKERFTSPMGGHQQPVRETSQQPARQKTVKDAVNRMLEWI